MIILTWLLESLFMSNFILNFTVKVIKEKNFLIELVKLLLILEMLLTMILMLIHILENICLSILRIMKKDLRSS